VLPAKELCALGRSKGVWVMLDAAHTPGMFPLDVQELGCDFLATCGHKWMMGPKGTGFLYVRQEKQDLLQPLWSGGGSAAEWDVAKGTLAFTHNAHRYDFASQNAALYTGLGAAVDFLRALGMDNVTRRIQGLSRRLRSALGSLGDRVEILTPDEPGGFGSLLGFRVSTVPFDRLYTTLLEKHKIITRMVPENGVNANRISTHIYNSPAEVDRVAGIICELARQ
jgi:selenocysteine lyase/cysteine desulfurase